MSPAVSLLQLPVNILFVFFFNDTATTEIYTLSYTTLFRSRMTITLHGDDVAVEQAAKQLYRLIDVLKVQDVTADAVVAQELALVKIRATDSNRAEILKLVELSKGRVVDLAGESVVVEVTGPESEIDGF